MNSSLSFKSIAVHPHHLKQNICGTRASYRDGRKDTAVKVYTVNQESIYLLISNVPAVGGMEDLQALCDQYGIVEDFRPLDDYPCEEFTEVYLVKYRMFPAARTAKKQLDDKSFLGSTLHVCYAPEFESVLDTKIKLQERRKYVAWRTNAAKSHNPGSTSERSSPSVQTQGPSKKRPSSSIDTLQQQQPVTYIWAGKEYTVYPEQSVPYIPVQPPEKASTSFFIPRQLQSKSTGDQNVSGMRQGSSSLKTEVNEQCATQNKESSYQNTISNVRSRISKVSVPNVRVSLKRRKRI